MPIRYVATLGAVFGITQVVNMVVIDCGYPTAVTRQAATIQPITVNAAANAAVVINVTPTLTPEIGGNY